MQSVLIVIPKRFVVSHKLALIVYHLLSTREAYNESVVHRCDEEALNARNVGSADKPLNSRFSSSPYRRDDVPWESASRDSGAVTNRQGLSFVLIKISSCQRPAFQSFIELTHM